MLISGDVIELDLGLPSGSEAGFRHPAAVVNAQQILDASPKVVHVVPLTSTIRGFTSEVEIDDSPANGLDVRSSAQCQHIRSVAASRVENRRGNVGLAALTQIREVLALILDVPG